MAHAVYVQSHHPHATKCLALKRAAIEDSHVHTHELLKRTAWSSTCRASARRGRSIVLLQLSGLVAGCTISSRRRSLGMRTLTSNTLEIGSRTWAVETRMRSWKRREIRSGILTSYERNFRWEEMLFGVKIRRYMDCRSVQRQRATKKFKTNSRHDRDRRKDINVVIGWVVNWENLVATFVVFF